MKNLAIAATLVGLFLTVAGTGCGARSEVAQERVLEKIDSVLGGMEVKRKEIEQSVSKLKDGLNELQRAKITSEVKHRQIERRAETVRQQVSRIDAGLEAVRTRLAADTSSDANRSDGDPKQFAQRLIRQRKLATEQLTGFKMAEERLERVVQTLEQRQADYEHRLARIEGQLAVIDSQHVALTAMKQAGQKMDGGADSVTENVARLEETVDDLFATVEAELRVEAGLWDNSMPEEVGSVDTMLAELRTPDDVLSEIDSLLGHAELASKSK